jgi:hypothetical protein
MDYVRVRIGCRNITKVSVVVEGLLDMYFYDFAFQREGHVEGTNNPGWNTWTRSTDGNDNPFPKKHKKRGRQRLLGSSTSSHDAEAGTSSQQQVKQHCSEMGKKHKKMKVNKLKNNLKQILKRTICREKEIKIREQTQATKVMTALLSMS